jgi:uncharacterized membrane protein YkoI
MNKTRTVALAAAAAALIGAGLGSGATNATTEPPTAATELDRASEAALAETGDGTVTAFEADLNGYEIEVRLADGTDVDVDLDSDFGVVRTRPDDQDDDDRNIDVENVGLQQAYDAALAEAGEGTVVSVEVDDGGYDVQVILDDRTEMEFDLNADFEIVHTERDD